MKVQSGQWSSNSIDSTLNTTAPLTILPKNAHAGKNVRLTFTGTLFANYELVRIKVQPSTAFTALLPGVNCNGDITIQTVRGLAPGTYQVTIYGWWSGITETGTITLS